MYNAMNHSNGMASADAVHGGHSQQQQQQQYAQQPRLAKQHSFRPTHKPQQQSPPNSGSSSGPRAKCDQVVFEAIAKAAEIVVASRCKIGTETEATGSGRFNLLVPEVKSVRNILQRWKRTMHVPLRLDVYYQHPPTQQHESGKRELLERWCLEYAPSSTSGGHYDGYGGSNNTNNNTASNNVDPIVQLRKVCKNIVVWLRTLYCHSRLLPAQALKNTSSTSSTTGNNNNSTIGFSIYVVGEGQDDVSGLVQQGFDSEPKGTIDGVPTPYGILGWRVYLAPKSLVRKLLAQQATALRPPVRHYSNTQAIPMKPTPSNAVTATAANHHQPPVARSAPSRGYRRSNSDSIAAHTHRDPSYLHPQQQPSPQQLQQQQYQQQTENPRYYSRSPSTLSAPRSYHHQGEFHNRYAEPLSGTTNTTRGIYGDNDGTTNHDNNSNQSTNEASSPSPKRNTGGMGGNKTKNLSALSLALMTMKDDNNNNNNNNNSNDDTPPSDPPTTTGDAQPKEELLSFPEKRRAALHNAPPTVVAATGVGEYGYAYNNQYSATSQQPPMSPHLSSSPAAYFKGPSTPASSTLGTTPPGYLLSATPSVGSHGTYTGGLLLPPKSAASGHAPPPFVRPLGFAGQAPEAKPLPDAASAAAPQQQQQQQQPPMLHPKPSLDLLHSSPFHHSASSGLHYHHHADGSMAAPQKDGLSSFLQAEETASMEAATTFINDFYHHHYPMAAASTEHDHHHLASTEDYYPTTEASLPDLLQADDMPFAVEGIDSFSPGKSLKISSTLNEASLMVASMGMVPQKKLALFEQSSALHSTTNDADTTVQCAVDQSVDDLTDQLADFRSFGKTLSSAPLTTSVGSGG